MVASALLSPVEAGRGSSPFPSSYSAKWDGAKGAFLLLKDLGYNVERWEQSPLELGDEESEVLILASPIQPATSEEKTAVAEFLRAGGRVVATGWAASQLLPQNSHLTEGFSLGDSAKFPALIPSPIARGAPEISMVPPERWRPESASELVVYGTDDTAAVITYEFGKGKVIGGARLRRLPMRVFANPEILICSSIPWDLRCARVICVGRIFSRLHGSSWTISLARRCTGARCNVRWFFWRSSSRFPGGKVHQHSAEAFQGFLRSNLSKRLATCIYRRTRDRQRCGSPISACVFS